MSEPFVYTRSVRFDEVDAARIVFFARFFGYCHEVMEAFFADLDGGYVKLIEVRRVGLPAVHVDADFKSPLRFGDGMRILLDVTRFGASSATLRYRFEREDDGSPVAEIRHVCASVDLDRLASIPLPDDVRALLVARQTEG